MSTTALDSILAKTGLSPALLAGVKAGHTAPAMELVRASRPEPAPQAHPRSDKPPTGRLAASVPPPPKRQDGPPQANQSRPEGRNLVDPLPANTGAEKSVLGCIMLDNAKYAEVAEKLTPGDFSLDSNKIIFRAMGRLIKAASRRGVTIEGDDCVNIVTLIESLTQSKELGSIGGRPYLCELTEGLPRHLGIGEFCRLVKEKAGLRTLGAIGAALAGSAYDSSATVAESIAQAQSRLADVATNCDPDGKGDNWRPLFHTYDEFLNAPPLVFAIGGVVQEQGVTLIGGLAGHSKTLFMLDMVSAMLNGFGLFDHFSVPRLRNKVLYLVPESGISPFWARLKLFHLEDHLRADRLLVRTLSCQEEITGLSDPRILKAAEGADIFLDTAVRFMQGGENDVEPSRIFAQTLFDLLAAGARTITGAHHSPKSFETQDRMTLEGVLRGSGDIGAMISTAWGLRQIDPRSNRVFVANLKARDFEPCEPFIIEGRPHLDEGGHFKLVAKPGEAGELRDYLNRKREKKSEAGELQAEGRTIREIADTLKVGKSTVSRWLDESDGKARP